MQSMTSSSWAGTALLQTLLCKGTCDNEHVTCGNSSKHGARGTPMINTTCQQGCLLACQCDDDQPRQHLQLSALACAY